MTTKRNTIEEHREKLREIIERDFSASLMNDTKWMEALLPLRKWGLQYRAKLITKGSPTTWGLLSVGKEDGLPVGWVEGCVGSPVLVLEIEWLEINPVTGLCPGQAYRSKPIDQSQEFEAHLRSVGVPFTRHGSVIRIWGHIRR